jgi:hypothetical protein
MATLDPPQIERAMLVILAFMTLLVGLIAATVAMN